MKWLYVLALFQLVAGPLVIFQVTLLCQFTIRDAPEQGWQPAFQKAWEQTEQHALAACDPVKATKGKENAPAPKPKIFTEKSKIPATHWSSGIFRCPPSIGLAEISEWSRRWTPVWPQAPPGPPPRVG